MNFSDQKYNVVVLDMQPIDPPTGGGRLRLLGLYHGLGENLPTRYIGTFDWPGEKFRKHRLSDNLVEVNIPLSDSHFSECKKWESRAGGKTIIDTAFHQLAHLSTEFIEYAKNEVSKADIIIFSHPWVYPLVQDNIGKNDQLIIYDSHNMEGLLRTTLLDDGDFGTNIVKEAIKVEYKLCHSANFILACSHDDRELFNRLYGVPLKKIRIVPNGVFTKQIVPVDQRTKKHFKQKLGIHTDFMAIFIGSSYHPNIEAASFICNTLVQKLPQITFAVCGSVGDGLDKSFINTKKIPNLRITGFLDENEKSSFLSAADLAINPMFSGSGSNIKMFEFMAAGLPIVTTSIGARGIEESSETSMKICPENNFASGVLEILNNSEEMYFLSKNVRNLAEEKYSWERISANLGLFLNRQRNTLNTPAPFFSVIIPTFERHDLLSKLIHHLSKQTYDNFEVIIVDQSSDMWPDRNESYGFDLFYIHTDYRGAAKARNLAASHARGDILAFTDDDCEPSPDWLQNARLYFEKPDVIGIEGIIKTENLSDQSYRTVTNEDFQGIGFMTANLFIMADIFHAINGFDERFDNPHFREDTDLAWRALEFGEIPFGHDVTIFHPPHHRSIERESSKERTKFFEKDALLLKKHPEKYKKLFLMEKHWENTPGFWENFLRGSKKYNIQIPKNILEYRKNDL
jgi:glycosyltransferase involved in cell wall biosynthesis